MGRWNLDILYTGFDTPEFLGDMESLGELVKDFEDFADGADKLNTKELLLGFIKNNEALSNVISKLAIYANLRYSADTRDSDAASMLGRIMASASALAAPSAKLNNLIFIQITSFKNSFHNVIFCCLFDF